MSDQPTDPMVLKGERVGIHFLLDLEECDRDSIRDKETVKAFIKHLVKTIGMKAHGEPIMGYLPESAPELQGWSIAQLIEYSSITMHTFAKTGYVALDIFTCKDLDKNKVIETVIEWLSPSHIKTRTILR